RCSSYAELLERAGEARAELDRLDSGFDPLDAAERALAEADARVSALSAGLRDARHAAAARFADAVAAELHGIGMGEGEFHVELCDREHGPTGHEDVAFLFRPNAGLPFAPCPRSGSTTESERVQARRPVPV